MARGRRAGRRLVGHTCLLNNIHMLSGVHKIVSGQASWLQHGSAAHRSTPTPTHHPPGWHTNNTHTNAHQPITGTLQHPHPPPPTHTHPPGRHQVVPGPLWSAARQDGGLHFQEAVVILQEAADGAGDGAAQALCFGCHLWLLLRVHDDLNNACMVADVQE